MKSNSMHPADAADTARVASAVCYVATIFIGTGRFDRALHGTLAEARVAARAMEAHYRNGRRALIYGVLPCGGGGGVGHRRWIARRMTDEWAVEGASVQG